MAHSSWPVSLARRKDLPPLLVLRSVPPPAPRARSAMLWGDASVARLAVRTAAAAVGRGLPVAVIDGAMAFDVTTVAAHAQARRVPPERFLRRIHIARAFTCHQVATLLCERLDPLLASQCVGLVILLGPCTTFFDENVPFKDAFLLFQRVLGKLEAICEHGPLLLIAQALDRHRTRRALFVRALIKVVELGIRVSTVEGRRRVQLVKPRGSQAHDGDLQST
ncbi:MAG TPA: hypothetical protein VHN13_17530 [Candidatus Tectomicrobia bacterium]|jgi:hypothetical protein|nr:hypothetical protein [Candidatus Tectomicrobia bacterium]